LPASFNVAWIATHGTVRNTISALPAASAYELPLAAPVFFATELLFSGARDPSPAADVKTTKYPRGTYTLSFTAGSDPVTHTAPFVIS
jgi:hypothetical protein